MAADIEGRLAVLAATVLVKDFQCIMQCCSDKKLENGVCTMVLLDMLHRLR